MIIQEFIADIITALSWTLLHSLWQGVVVFAFLALLLRVLSRQNPGLRYQVLCLGLLSLVSWMVITFMLYLPAKVNQTQLVQINPGPSIDRGEASPVRENTTVYTSNIASQFRKQVASFVHFYANHLVFFWMLGVGFFAIRWLFSFYWVQQLRIRDVELVPSIWQSRLNSLCRTLQVRRAVHVLESAWVEAPVLIGHFKPVILVPIGTFSGIEPQHIEALLVHELAHLKRHDYLINLIISILEIILFYHPAYWWIADRIHKERELCCDDLAVATCGNARLYAKTLLLMEEKRNQNALALSLRGKQQHLLYRIQRICLTQAAKRNPEVSRILLSGCFLCLIAIASWAQMPTTPEDFDGKRSMDNSEPTNLDLKEKKMLEPSHLSPEMDLALVDIPAENEPAHQEITNTATEPMPDLIRGPSLALVEPARIAKPVQLGIHADTVPNVPSIGTLPAIPPFPDLKNLEDEIDQMKSAESIDSDRLKELVREYKDQIEQWDDRVEVEYLAVWRQYQKEVYGAFQEWKSELKSAYGENSLKYAIALKNKAEVFEEALEGNENAIEQAEDNIERNLEDLIEDVEDTVERIESDQDSHDDRMEIHRTRMAIHNLRMSVHHTRMTTHRARMDLHRERMDFHRERMAAHRIVMDAFREEIFGLLEKEGFWDPENEELDFQAEDGQITINGQTLSGTQAEKYFLLLRKYGIDIPESGAGKFIIQIDKNSKRFGSTYHSN